MDLKKILVTMGIFGLLLYSIMAFIITTQDDSDVAYTILSNEVINESYGGLRTNLSSSAAETSAGNFANVSPTQSFGEVEVSSIFSPTKTAKTIILGFWNIMVKLPQSILGVSPVVAGIINSILIIFIIIGIWAIWKGVISP